ncbi:MAG: hypothetical protein JKY49_06850 [Cohaesibacteraceae bacterium]|nr:hypothetical protein [Cohaesibacteraceae bacterium]MBL4876723.1 hypothetical protein [Cohaesibacteraceae bacterium]
MANTDEFHHGLRFKRVGSGLGAIEIYDTTTIGMNLTAPDADNTIPRDEPFLIFRSDTEKRQALGAGGTAAKYLDALFAGVAGAAVVVNIFDEGADIDAALTNAVGSQTSQSGLYAFEAANGHVNLQPKIILTPGYTNFRVDNAANPVLVTQGLIADRLGAIHITAAPGSTDQDAIDFRNDIDDFRAVIIEPFVKTLVGQMTAEAHLAAIAIQTDKKVGFHASWGNKIIPGALGISRHIPFFMTDSDSRANYLLGNQINTMINHQGGWRTWGDYAATTDTKRRFYCQTRVVDIINETVARHVWRVISEPLVEDQVTTVLDRLNELFASLVNDGKLLGGRATFKGNRNAINALELGKIVVSYDQFSPPPITLIDFEETPEPKYLEILVKGIIEKGNFKD